MTLEVVYWVRRLGTSRLRPAASTGWKETAEESNSKRALAWTIWRVTMGAKLLGWRSAWHLKQTSYSNLATGVAAPDAVMPGTLPMEPRTSGAAATALALV